MPGSLEVIARPATSAIDVIRYTEDDFNQSQANSLAELPLTREAGRVTWININGVSDTSVLLHLQKRFGLHDLALEDAVTSHQRPKVEVYDDHVFIVLRMFSENSVHSEQLSIFLGPQFVITLQESPGDCLDPVRQRLKKGWGKIRAAPADYLAYAIVDAVIDAYFPVVDALGDEIEAVEETILADGSKNVAQRLHHLRGDLSELRRAIRPLRDALNHLMPDPHELFHERTQLYLRDCYDHTVQLIDLLDTYREMCTDLRDFHLSAVNQRMNEVMKFLTIIATIFIPLSFITGVYGMNFNTSQPGNMPELNLPFGYAIVWAVMLSVALGLIGFIWRKGWLQPTE